MPNHIMNADAHIKHYYAEFFERIEGVGRKPQENYQADYAAHYAGFFET